jgi:hypothetical protein
MRSSLWLTDAMQPSNDEPSSHLTRRLSPFSNLTLSITNMPCTHTTPLASEKGRSLCAPPHACMHTYVRTYVHCTHTNTHTHVRMRERGREREGERDLDSRDENGGRSLNRERERARASESESESESERERERERKRARERARETLTVEMTIGGRSLGAAFAGEAVTDLDLASGGACEACLLSSSVPLSSGDAARHTHSSVTRGAERSEPVTPAGKDR